MNSRSHVWRRCTASLLWIVPACTPVPKSISMLSTRKRPHSSFKPSSMRPTWNSASTETRNLQNNARLTRRDDMPAPIKIGWLGAALDGPGGGYDKIHRMAFDEGVESGLLDRPYEFLLQA